METRPLGKTGLRVSEIGICLPPDARADALVRRARERGCSLFHSERPIDAPVVLPGSLSSGCELIRYNLIDQTEANRAIPRIVREGKGVVATHVLAGGALAGRVGHVPRGAWVDQLRFLVKPGRTLAQAAVQFVLANESVSCVLVRVSSLDHLDEVLSASDAIPLSGQDLEQVFELWSNRYDSAT